MSPESQTFLANNRHHYDTLIRAQYLQHVDYAFKERVLNIIRTEFDPGYNALLWCGPCVADMIKLAWSRYDKWLEKNVEV